MELSNQMSQGGVAEQHNHQTKVKVVRHTGASEYHIKRGREGI